MPLEAAQVLELGSFRRPAEEGREGPDVPDVAACVFSVKRRIVMSAILRQRSGLMAFGLVLTGLLLSGTG